ncbi:S8 family serine peptidase [Psychromicrobium sp. YIM B11713]|uniref:S8 family serine peptidase n=1 Tax=Psychromicrobium sp. YIM B11713 TaxID=3145233 RepID=UPI00374E5EFE
MESQWKSWAARGIVTAVTAGSLVLAAGVTPAAATDSAAAGSPQALSSVLKSVIGQALAESSQKISAKSVNGVSVPLEISVAPGKLESVKAALLKAGLSDIDAMSEGPLPTIYGKISASSVQSLTSIPGIRRISPANWGSFTDVGTALSQGDSVVQGPSVRNGGGPNGAGVKIGVISDSINKVGSGVAGSQSTGDLPASVSVLTDGPSGSSDEGRAMAEIIFDEAPGVSSIAFSSASSQKKAQAIRQLVASGVKVIADDIYDITAPVYQNGPEAIAVEDAVASGVTYFSSAGNRGAQSAWEFAPSFVKNASTGVEYQDFGSGVTKKKIATLAAGKGQYFDIQWKEAWGSASSNLDVQLVDSSGKLLTQSNDDNVSSGIPQEGLSYTNSSATSSKDVYLQVTHKTGTSIPSALRIRSNGNLVAGLGNVTTINAGASSSGASLAVAASDWSAPTVPETYSSRGAVTHYFDDNGNTLAQPWVMPGPAVMAPDCVATSVKGFSAFCGTSAAAPAAAGVAALALSAVPTATPSSIRAALASGNATVPAAAGYGVEIVGSGLIQADKLIAALQSAG